MKIGSSTIVVFFYEVIYQRETDGRFEVLNKNGSIEQVLRIVQVFVRTSGV